MTEREKSRLPEKKWFTLREIAERWKTDVETLVHYAETELMEVGEIIRLKEFEWDPKPGLYYKGAQYRAIPFADVRDALHQGDVVVSRNTRDNFEREHRVGAHAGEMPQGSLGERERKGMLRTIAALVELIKTHRPGRDTNEKVITELIDNYGEKEGISERTLKARFAEGRKLLDEP